MYELKDKTMRTQKSRTSRIFARTGPEMNISAYPLTVIVGTLLGKKMCDWLALKFEFLLYSMRTR